MTNAEIIKALDCPFYEDDNILFLNTDCMKLMELLPDKFFDLAICDPPYGIGNFTQSDRKNKYGNYSWNTSTPEKKYFNKIRNISKNQIIWGANYYNCFDEKGGAIIWNKDNPHPSMSMCEIASQSFYKKVDYVYIKHYGFYNSDINSIHPCQKPIALYLWLLDNYANPNDLIFDSHAGSASSLIACMQKGFKCIGTELDADYFNDAVKRIKLERARIDGKFYLPEDQNNLFGGLT